MGGVDELAVAPDGADAVGLRPAGSRRSTGARLGDLLGGGREDLVGDRDLVGVDRPLAVEAEQAGVRGRSPVAVGVLVGGVRRVDGVDARGAGRGQDLDAGEVPEVAGVVA